MNLNKAMIIGNLTRDPESRNTPSGQTVTNFAVATNFTWTDQSGQKQERVEYHNIVTWRKLAEISAQYLKKGSKVYIEGRMQTRSWDDAATNTKKYKTEIIADSMIMLDKADGSARTNAPTQAQSAPADDYSQEAPASADEINVEDIPF